MALNYDVILSAAKNLAGDGRMLRLWVQPCPERTEGMTSRQTMCETNLSR